MTMNKEIIVVVQCHIAKEYCSGYFCEYCFTNRLGKFDLYPEDENLRIITLTCGGCCGRATHRKLSDLIKRLKKQENIEKNKIVVHLSSCIAFDSYHGQVCPHKDYLKTIIQDKLGLELIEGTKISNLAEKRRKEGTYSSCD